MGAAAPKCRSYQAGSFKSRSTGRGFVAHVLENGELFFGQLDLAADLGQQRTQLDPALRLHGSFQDVTHLGLDAEAVSSGPHTDSAMHFITHISHGNGWHVSKPHCDADYCTLEECKQPRNHRPHPLPLSWRFAFLASICARSRASRCSSSDGAGLVGCCTLAAGGVGVDWVGACTGRWASMRTWSSWPSVCRPFRRPGGGFWPTGDTPGRRLAWAFVASACRRLSSAGSAKVMGRWASTAARIAAALDSTLPLTGNALAIAFQRQAQRRHHATTPARSAWLDTARRSPSSRTAELPAR